MLRATLIVSLAAVLFWLATATAVNGIFATRAPNIALSWAPWSSVARISKANALIGGGTTAPPSSVVEARRLAEEALARSPVQAAGARVLGLAALMTNDETRARTAFTYAERLSRRDLPTQLYWIQASVARGDIRAALHHYDIAMRTSVKSRALLGNVVIAAASEPPIATELAQLLRTHPSWRPEFYQRLMSQGENPATLRYIAGAMGFDARDPSQAPFVAMALDRLVKLGAYRDAASLYRNTRGGDDAALVRNGGFEQTNRLPPFDWTIASDPAYSGIVEQRTGWPHGNVLTVTGTDANDVARQMLLLARGQYRLSAATANVREAREARPTLTITCIDGSRIVATIPFAAAGTVPAAMNASFIIPPDCPAQWLTIRNTPPFDPVDSDPWIDQISITRVAGS